MARANRYIFAIPMATEWSCTWIALGKHGRTRRMASSPCTHGTWISGHCWRNCRRTKRMKFRQPEICRTFLKQLALSNSALPRLASFRQNSGSINHLPCSSSCGQLRRIPAITEVCIKAYCLALILLPILGAGLAAQQPPSDAPRAHIITGELTHANRCEEGQGRR
jgi:hypothetical protein